jgi:hypothetical protein
VLDNLKRSCEAFGFIRSGIDCAGTLRPFPGIANFSPHHYDAYTFVNTTGSLQTVAVTLEMTDLADFSATYFSSFNPANIATNYLADAGATALTSSYSFNIDPGCVICGHRERDHRRGTGRTLHFDRSDRCGSRSRPHRRCWTSRPDLGERWLSRLVATAAEKCRRTRSARTYRPSSKKRRLSAAGSREQYRI